MKLAHEIVAHRLTLVYGGSRLDMMGLLEKTVKELGGKSIGLQPHIFDKEKPLDILDELHIVSTMQDRKKMLQHWQMHLSLCLEV
jgi:predicted Rossmann-fold nucleotide-binding protein